MTMIATAAELQRSLLFSEELGILLRKRSEREYFKWFLASLLFGGRISATVAKNTYRAFQRHDLLAPAKILAAGWDFLVNPIMREGGYVRYDGRKSTQILRDCERLIERYRGRLTALHEAAANSAELERSLLDFYGIGPVTVNIFLRELRPYWKKADPQPLPQVYEMARALKLDLNRLRRKTVRFSRVEAGLMRLYLRQRRVARRGRAAARREERAGATIPF